MNFNEYRFIQHCEKLEDKEFLSQLIYEYFFVCLFKNSKNFDYILNLLELTKNYNNRSLKIYNSFIFFKEIGLVEKEQFINLLLKLNLLNCKFISLDDFIIIYFNIVFNLLRCFPNKLSLYFELGSWFCEFFKLPNKSHDYYILTGEKIINVFKISYKTHFVIRELGVNTFSELSHIKISGELSVLFRLDTLRLGFQSNIGSTELLLDLQCLFYLLPSCIPCRPWIFKIVSNYFFEIQKTSNFLLNYNNLACFDIYYTNKLYLDKYLISFIQNLYGSSFCINYEMLVFLINKEPSLWKKLELEFISEIVQSRDRNFKIVKKLRRLVSKDKTYTKMYFEYRKRWELESLFLNQYKSFERLLLMFLRFPSLSNFFFSYRFDEKFNLFPHQSDLSPAGSQIFNSLLLSTQYKNFDLYIFKLYTSSIFSKKRLTEKQLLSLFNDKLSDMLISFPTGLSKIWRQAKEPFIFISCCYEYQRFLKFRKLKKNFSLSYKSNFLCYLDFKSNVLKVNQLFIYINNLKSFPEVFNLSLSPINWFLSDFDRILLIFFILNTKKISLKFFIDFIILLKFISGNNQFSFIFKNKIGLHSIDIKNIFLEMDNRSLWLKNKFNLLKIKNDFLLIAPFFSKRNYIKLCNINFRFFKSIYF